MASKYMRLALRLAAKAKGKTRPNPMVGAILVRRGQVVGQGFHQRAGLPHAEVIALRRAGARARGATLYVTLEPCSHTGRTGPCVEAILRAGVKKVVAAMPDPNPKVRGRGLQRLRAHGVKTRVGLLSPQARSINRVFVTWMTRRRPFVTVKVAQSLDGKIATVAGESRWISSPAARRWAHGLRSQADAVLVGVETVLKDDPRLTVRLGKGNVQPIRVILDSHLRTPSTARLFSFRSPVVIAAARSAPSQRQSRLERAGAEVLRLPSRQGRVDLRVLLRELAKREISHLLIEGGGEAIASAFKAKAVDRVAWLIAPKIIGGRRAPTAVGGDGVSRISKAIPLVNVSGRFLGPDLLVEGDVHWDH